MLIAKSLCSLALLIAAQEAFANSLLFTYGGAGTVAVTVGPSIASLTANNDSITAPSSTDVAIAFANTGGAHFTSTGPATFTGAIDFSDAIGHSTGGSCPSDPGGICKVDTSSSISNTTITGVTAFNPSIASAAVSEWNALTNTSTGWGSVAGTAANLASGGTLCIGSGGTGCTYTAPTASTLIINGISQSAYVFNITGSGDHINGNVIIKGDGTDNAMVILNYGGTRKLQSNKVFTLANGLLSDQVLLNNTSSGGMQTSGGFSYSGALAISGSTINLDAAGINGRLYVYGTSSVSIQSGFNLTAPEDVADSSAAPEPATTTIMAGGLVGLLVAARLKWRSA